MASGRINQSCFIDRSFVEIRVPFRDCRVLLMYLSRIACIGMYTRLVYVCFALTTLWFLAHLCGSHRTVRALLIWDLHPMQHRPPRRRAVLSHHHPLFPRLNGVLLLSVHCMVFRWTVARGATVPRGGALRLSHLIAGDARLCKIFAHRSTGAVFAWLRGYIRFSVAQKRRE